jgi:putative ABC transport system permease protein
VNYGASGTEKVLDQIRRLGTNVLIITPAQSRSLAGRARTGAAVTTLVERDYVALKRDVQARTRSSALVTESFWIKAGDLSKNAAVVGCEPDYFVLKDWTAQAGDVFDRTQDRTASRVAVLGHTVAVDLFGTSSPVGRPISINRVPFTIVGVLHERGQGLDISSEDSQVFVPLKTAMRRLMNTDHFAGILVEINSLQQMDQAASQVRTLLRQDHHTPPNQPEDFQVQNQKTLLDTQMAAAKRLNFFLNWIGISALIVSGLGIVAITSISVRERTREIGTRRALGATAADILIQMQWEGSSLAIVGGLVGIGLSWPISYLLATRLQLPFVFDDKVALAVFGIAAALNFAFSLISSGKAASISPIEALHYE